MSKLNRQLKKIDKVPFTPMDNLVNFTDLENGNGELTGNLLDSSQSTIANKVNEIIDWQNKAEDRTIVSGFGINIDDSSEDIVVLTLAQNSIDYLGSGVGSAYDTFINGIWEVGKPLPNFPIKFSLTNRAGSTQSTRDIDLSNPNEADNILYAGQRFSITNNAGLSSGSTWTRTSTPWPLTPPTSGSNLELFVVTSDTTVGFVTEGNYIADKTIIAGQLIDHNQRLVDAELVIPNTLRIDGTRIARTQDIYSMDQVDSLIAPVDSKADGNKTLIDSNIVSINNLNNLTSTNTTNITTLTNQQSINTADLTTYKPKVVKNTADIAGLNTRVGKNEADILTNASGISNLNVRTVAVEGKVKKNEDEIGSETISGSIKSRLKVIEDGLASGGKIVTSIKKYSSNVGLPKESGWTASKAVFNLANLINNNDGTKPVFDFTDENIFDVKIRFTIGNPALSEKINILFSINTGDDEPTILTFNDRAGSNANTGVILKAQLTTTGTLTVEVVNVDGTAPAFSVINFADLVVTQIQEFGITAADLLVSQSDLSALDARVSANEVSIPVLTTTVGTKADSITVTSNKQEFDNYKTSNDAAVAAAQTNANSRVLQTDYNTKMSALDNSIQANATAIGNKVAQTDYDIKMSALDSQISALAKKLTPAVTGVGEELLKELETKLGI